MPTPAGPSCAVTAAIWDVHSTSKPVNLMEFDPRPVVVEIGVPSGSGCHLSAIRTAGVGEAISRPGADLDF
jgi:hypothetical protein